MSALYQMRYQGIAGGGHGAMYIGKGKIVGVDIAGARYVGSYTDVGATLNGAATLTSAGAPLVTGQAVPAGAQVPVTFSLPQNFANGQFHTVIVAGRPAQIAFDKVGDVP